MTQHVMLDLETLGTQNSSVVLQIGAVKFEYPSGKIIDTLDLVLPTWPQTQRGRTVDVNTVSWWMKQSVEAQRLFHLLPTCSVEEALKRFTTFYTGCSGLWGNGATFDNVILQNMYEQYNVPAPWGYRHNMCFRTARFTSDVPAPSRSGDVPHNGLDDALYQVQWLAAILNKDKDESV